MFDIAEFLAVAEAVLGVDASRLRRVTKISLAESALAAPFATFGGHDFYEDPVEQAAVLASRIMRNHPLPDGNKRVALILMDLHLRNHGWQLDATPAEIDHTLRAVAGRALGEDRFVAWVRAHASRLEEDAR